MKIAIIGGGISGLTTAFYLNQLDSSLHVDIYEKKDYLGGKMKTQQQDDFYFECGVNGFLSNKPSTLDLVNDSNAQHLLIKSNDLARIRYIYKNGLHVMPESLKAFVKTPLLSTKAKLRVLCEPFIKAKKNDNDESLQSFGYRRVGKEMTDTFLDAMVAGVFASTTSSISVNAAFPLVVNLEKQYGSLFAGMLKKRKKSAGPGGVLMSFEKGVSTFVEHLAKKCHANIFLNSTITSIQKTQNGYKLINNNTVTNYDKIILSTPAYESSKLLTNIDKHLSELLEKIQYSPISIVGFGYDKLKNNLNGFGLLTTTSSKLDILGVLWDSSVFTDRALNGKKCIRVMIGGQRNKDLALRSQRSLIEFAKKDILKTMNIDEEPSCVFVKSYKHGIPNYTLGHQARMNVLFERLKKHDGLYLNSNAYKGIALNDCVANSKQCAMQVLA